jgi:hypothetical protein
MEFFLIFIYIAIAVFFFIAWAQIFSKAGYSGWLCLLLIIPLVNIIIFFWFAFSRWPVLRGSDIQHTLPS